jgi:hypothetical protein
VYAPRLAVQRLWQPIAILNVLKGKEQHVANEYREKRTYRPRFHDNFRVWLEELAQELAEGSDI